MTNLPKTESRINYDLFTAWDTQDLKNHFEYLLKKVEATSDDIKSCQLVRTHLLERGEAEWLKIVHWEIMEMVKEGVL